MFNSEFCEKNCSHFGHTVPLHQSASVDGGHPVLGEEKRVQGNETMIALPPRSLRDVSHTVVTQDPPSQDTVDRVAPIEGNSTVSEVESLVEY